jgi:hypothetical protein
LDVDDDVLPAVPAESTGAAVAAAGAVARTPSSASIGVRRRRSEEKRIGAVRTSRLTQFQLTSFRTRNNCTFLIGID